jgi:ArsR family metal-binding transcriptional regulator
LIRIPIRQGIRLQGQGKVTIKLVKHNNNADETIGEAKLEVAKLLPHKTDFSVLRISSSVQLSLQAAFLPQRVQVIYARCLLIAADFGIIHVRS